MPQPTGLLSNGLLDYDEIVSRLPSCGWQLDGLKGMVSGMKCYSLFFAERSVRAQHLIYIVTYCLLRRVISYFHLDSSEMDLYLVNYRAYLNHFLVARPSVSRAVGPYVRWSFSSFIGVSGRSQTLRRA